MFKKAVFLFIAAILFNPHPAYAQQAMQDVVESQQKTPPMRTMRFGKPKEPATEKPASALTEGSSEDGMVTEVPAEKISPPEEDVWEKYQSLAAGANNKPMARKKMKVEEEAEDSEDEEDTEEEPEASPKKSSKKKKGFMSGILENYKAKQEGKGDIHSKSLNE